MPAEREGGKEKVNREKEYDVNPIEYAESNPFPYKNGPQTLDVHSLT